jgi:hypothetical protein
MDGGVRGASDDGSASRVPTSASTPGSRSASEPIDHGCVVRDVDVRLEDAASTGKTLELVVVLRGTVHRRRGHARPLWRVRLPDGHYRVVSPESIVAATPVKKEGVPHKPVDGFASGR